MLDLLSLLRATQDDEDSRLANRLENVLPQEQFFLFDGSGWLSTPHKTEFVAETSINVRIDYEPDNPTPPTLQVLVGQWNIFGSQGRAWFFDVQPDSSFKPGNFNVEIGTPDGAGWLLNFAAEPGSELLPAEGRHMYEFNLVCDDGAGGKACQFYRDGIEIGTAGGSTRPGTLDIFPSSADLIVGANNDGSGNRFEGKIYRVELRVDDTLVAVADANDFGPGATVSISTETGEVWTLHNASIGSRIVPSDLGLGL